MANSDVETIESTSAPLTQTIQSVPQSSGATAHGLPSEPLVVIEPAKSRPSFDLGEIWSHRELLYFLVWRDLKVRYKQTALGMAWVVLQPLLMTFIFTVVLGKLVRVPSNGIPYSLFAYSGLILWTFFSGAVLTTGNSLVGNAHLITKVYFPRLILPMAAIIARVVDLGVVFLILAGLMFYFRISVSWRVLLAVVPVVLISVFALALGLWCSAVNVKYRDVGYALPVVLQLWMFASPVVYGMNLIPARWQTIYSINPLVGIIESFRAALFGGTIQGFSIIASCIITLVALLYGAYTFKRREKVFADII